MTRFIGLQMALRMFWVWLVVGLFFYAFGEYLLIQMLPLLTCIADGLAEHFRAELSMGEGEQGIVINIAARITEDIMLKITL